MKVGLVLDRFDPAAGGLESWVWGFARFLQERGHAPHVLAFDAAEGSPVPVHRLEAAGSVLGRARSAAAGVAALGADVVLDTGTGWSGDVFMPCTGSRQVSQRRLVAAQSRLRRLRASVSPVSVGLDVALGTLERQQMRRARRVIAVSEMVRGVLEGRHRVEPGKIAVVRNGAEVERFGAARPAGERAALRASLGIDPGEEGAVLFVVSARNMWLKGVDVAIRALDLLVYEEAPVHLAIAGAAPDEAWRRMGAASGDRVRFLGPVADMAALFGAADALVHPTRWDACSLSTIEAGAAGLPVITSAANGAAELIAEGETGFVVTDAEDVGAVAERMRRLLDGAVRGRMGAAARAAAAGQGAAANYGAVLEVLLSSRGGSGAGAGP